MGDAMAKEERICKFIKDELSGANLELMRQVVGGLKLKLGSLLEKSPAPADESDGARKLSEINKVLADEDNDNLIFKPVWLKKGIAAMISAPSGVGKSTLAMQFAYSWALGRGMFGLNPVRPLRIGILESEDDEDEMLMFRDSMKRGYMKFCGWTEEEVKAAENRIYSIPTEGKTGKEFVDLLKQAQLKAIKRDNAPYDLIIINPLMGFTGFDLSDNSKMLAFTRDWLDPVIKGMDPELPVRTALLIINHLTKVNKDAVKFGFGSDEFSQYAAYGGGALSAWIKATFTIINDIHHKDWYKLVMGKRSKHVDWPPTPPQMKSTATMKMLRQNETTPEDGRLLFWHEVPWSEVVPGWTEDGGNSSGQGFNVQADAKLLAKLMGDEAKTKTELTKLAESCEDLQPRERGRAAQKYLVSNYQELGLDMRRMGKAEVFFCRKDEK